MNILDIEIETYESAKDELLRESNGKFVLIKGKEILGVFNSFSEANEAGLRQFGPSIMLIRQILVQQEPIFL